jgi:pentapeptide repeat protein
VATNGKFTLTDGGCARTTAALYRSVARVGQTTATRDDQPRRDAAAVSDNHGRRAGAAATAITVSAGNGSADTGGGANLTAADLTGADLSHANLAAAKLTAANLTQVFYDKNTTWPQGFIPPPSRAAP